MRTWLPIEIGLSRHRKTRELARLWNTTPQAVVGFLLDFWGYLLEYQPDGDAAAIPVEDLEHMACAVNSARIGVVKTALEELQSVGFVDRDGHAHDWDEYAGRIIEKREANRKRMARKRKDGRRRAVNSARDVQDTCDERAGAVVQHSTAQNKDTTHPADADIGFLRSVANGYPGLDVLLMHLPDTYFPELARAVRAAEAPYSVVAGIRDVGPGGMQHAECGRPTWPQIGQALRDCLGTKDGYTPIKFRAFVKRIAAGEVVESRAASRQARAFEVIDGALGEAS